MVALPERQTLQKPLRVLLVEDSENDALLLLRELGRAGYEVEHVRVHTAEAMREALQSPWEVIISDYRMPRFSAMEALQMASASGSDAPFIVVSGRIGEDVAVEAMRCGAYDYVMKSNLARLPRTVERGLEKAEERRERRRIEEELERRDAILEAVRFAADQFLGEAAGWEESVRAVLRRLGEATEASRVYVCENFTGADGELWAALRYEWVARGIIAQIDTGVEGVPYKAAGFGRWIHTLGRGDLVYGHVRDLPKGEQPELQFEDILSIVLVPIFVEGRWWGYIGFDECVEEREWSTAEVGALGAAAGTLGAAIRRRQTEERLRGSEERYRAVIEQATDGIYLLDAETRRLVETNPSFQRMLGYTVEEIEGLCVYDFVAHPRENVDATIARTLQSRRRIVGERKYRRKDGTLLDVEVGVSVISLDGRDVICTIVRDVTERKENEELLAHSEGRLRQIIETEPECVKVLGANGSLLEMNPAGLSMIEADSLEQVRGRSVYRYIAPGHRDAFVALTEKVLRGGSGTLEFELVGLKGTRRWLETHAVPLRDAGGGTSGLLAITRDVTERKHTEKALKESERLYRAVIEQATENIFLIDVETRRIVESNHAFREALGYSEEELRRMTLYDFVTADRESVDRNLRRTLEEGRFSVGERRYRRKDGTLIDVEVGGSVILRDGRETLVAVAHDITERKQNEEALEESRRALATLMSNLPGMAYRCRNDEDWTMQFVSEGCFGLTGYSPDELVDNRVVAYGDLIHPDDAEMVWESVQVALRELRPFQFTYRIMTASGTSRWVWEQGQGVFSPSGQLVALEGFVTDTTERKRVQELLEERVATLSGIASDLTLDRPTEALLGALAESVVNASTAVACGIVLISEQEGAVDLFGSHGLPEGYTAGLREAYRAGVQSPSLEAFRSRRPVLVRDLRDFLLADPLYSPIHRLCSRGAVGRRVQPAARLPGPGSGRDLLLLSPRRGARRGREGVPAGRRRPGRRGRRERPALLRGSRQGRPRRAPEARPRTARLRLPGPLRHHPRGRDGPRAPAGRPRTRRRAPRLRHHPRRSGDDRDAGAHLRAAPGVVGERGTRGRPRKTGRRRSGASRHKNRGRVRRRARRIPRNQGDPLPHRAGSPAQHRQARPRGQREGEAGRGPARDHARGLRRRHRLRRAGRLPRPPRPQVDARAGVAAGRNAEGRKQAGRRRPHRRQGS